jgi:hypothetical protein
MGKRELIGAEIRYREALYGDFIRESSKQVLASLERTLDKPETLLPVYELINRIRVSASDAVLAEAEHVLERIMEQYFEPNLSVEEVRAREVDERRSPEVLRRGVPRGAQIDAGRGVVPIAAPETPRARNRFWAPGPQRAPTLRPANYRAMRRAPDREGVPASRWARNPARTTRTLSRPGALACQSRSVHGGTQLQRSHQASVALLEQLFVIVGRVERELRSALLVNVGVSVRSRLSSGDDQDLEQREQVVRVSRDLVALRIRQPGQSIGDAMNACGEQHAHATHSVVAHT